MLVSFFRYAKGFVEFTAEGRSPERFMNLCAQRGINLWGARPVSKGIQGRMSAKDYKGIRPAARRAGVRTRIVKKRGAPFYAARYRGRIGIPIGAALGIALLIFLSNFIWTIHISGAEHVSEQRLLRFLSESGIKVGAFRNAADARQAKRDVLLKVDELGWMSVNIIGSHAEIEVREKARKPELEDNLNPCNIMAAADGVITKIFIGNGVSNVKEGSGVAKGDLLVSGLGTTKRNTVRYVRAKAEIYADVNSAKELKLPKSYTYNSISENKTERSLFRFLGFSLPCSLSFRSFDSSAYSVSERPLEINGVELPLGIAVESEHELKSDGVSPGREQAERVFNTSLLLYEIFERGSGKEVKKKVSITEGADGYFCKADYVFNENIAESVDFSVEE